MLFPLFWSVFYGSRDSAAFIVSIPLVGIPGLLLARLKAEPELWLRDTFVIVTGGWILSAVVGAIPYLLAGSLAHPVDAFFEAMSGLTTTGASVLTNVEAQPPGILFWRSYLHWLGGMGIIVIFLAILPRLEIGGSQLFRAEVPGPAVQRLRPRIKDSAKVLWYIYGALSLVQIVLLALSGMSVYEAMIHTFGTMATGGFSTRNASIGAYSSPVAEAIIILFMLAAGVNFGLYYKAFYFKDASGLLKDPEFRAYVGIAGAATLVVTLDLLGSLAPLQALRQSAFQVVSIMTTTGYATSDFDSWPEFSRAVLLLLMFVGASAGSTGGAMKVIRLMLLAKLAYREIYRMLHASAVLPLRYGDHVVPDSTIRQVMGFAIAYMTCFIAGTLFMCLIGLDMLSAAASIAATLGNIGPGLGLVGPETNYAFIPVPGKIVLSFMMLLGRLELLTVLVLLSPAFWKR
jgi:trk system potassium uptake protein TrkH